MTAEDQRFMEQAIEMAEQCGPIADRIPKVGAVIVAKGVVIGKGSRGSGKEGDDDHAEWNALEKVPDRRELTHATVYTTLEPCTPEVRSDPLTCCTKLIRQSQVKKVFIGILDPNQGVTGKGLWELQSNGIEVELFPPKLAEHIRVLNQEFIREQQRLGIRIENVTDGQKIRTSGRVFELRGTFLNPPGPDVYGFVSIGSSWWPQYPLSATDKGWSVKLHLGGYGPRTLSIVRANELGMALINYYRKIVSDGEKHKAAMQEYLRSQMSTQTEAILPLIGTTSPPIGMAKLPKGLELQAQVEVIVETPPHD